MMKLKKLIFSFLFVFLTTENLFAKALPPGTGIGDVPANVLILLDKSGSMGWRMSGGLASMRYPYDADADSSVNILVSQYNRDGVKKFLYNNFNDIKKNWPKKLPSGIIHGDLFIDNIFFNKNKVSGYIDFYFAANDHYMYEIAICINALCFDEKNKKFIINKKKVDKLIKGYNSVKKIKLNEKNNLNILCRGAALRYLLTRLYDYTNTPKTALIKIKDPNEYYQKLITHNNLNSFKDYLI